MEKEKITMKYFTLAKYYDALLSYKRYAQEVNFLHLVFQRSNVKKIIDIGCGTGTHAVLLAKNGYKVTGIDLSSEMLKIARKKARENGVNIRFLQANMKNFNTAQKFDAAISMTSTFSYLLTNKDIKHALFSVKKSLKRGGLFIFSFFCAFGALVHNTYKKTYTERGTFNDGKITAIIKHNIDVKESVQYCDELYTVKEGKKIKRFKLESKFRIMTPQEASAHLSYNGFRVIEILGGADYKKKNVKDEVVIIAKNI